MNHKSLHILVMVLLTLALVSPASQALSAEIDAFIPTNHQAASLVLGQQDLTHSLPAASQSGMYRPAGIAVDPTTGKVFVAENGNSRVLRFASVQALANGPAAEAVLGQANFTDHLANRGGSPAANTMDGPMSVSVDPAGRLWVADKNNHRVLRFDHAAVKTNGADADGVLGQPDFTSNPHVTTQSGMYWPWSLFADASGRLWVADTYNMRVLRFDNAAAKANGALADGVLGQANFTSSVTATTRDGMRSPTGLWVDSDGRMWVADSDSNRVLRFENAAGKSNGANADGVLGQADFTHSGNACSQGGMESPQGVSIDPSGRLYVVDSYNSRVLVFNDAAGRSNGTNADLVLGQPNFTTCTNNTGGLSAASLLVPFGIFFDSSAGILWVADYYNNRVLMYGKPFQIANLVLGQPDFTSRTSHTSQNGMGSPSAMAVDPTTGKVFVSEFLSSRVLRFASVSALSNGADAEAVLGQADFSQANGNRGGSVAANTLYYPRGIFVDSAGRLWVADLYNNRVLRFDHAASKADGADADGVLGQTDFTTSGWDYSQNGMQNPAGVFVDSGGRLWVGDFSNNRVLRFDHAAAKADGADADGVLGQANYNSNGAAVTQNGMREPSGLYIDALGRLYVADVGNNRVLRFDAASGLEDGSNANGVLGQADYIHSGYSCTQAGMYSPGDLSGDPAGQLYVVDAYNNRVLVFEHPAGATNGINASRVLGQPDFTTCTANTGTISAASLFFPTGVFFDRTASVLWVADNNNARVLMYGVPQYQVFAPLVRK